MQGLDLMMLAAVMLLGASRPATEPLEWLSGCWRLARGSTVVDEQWLRPSGGMMLGTARTMRAGTVVEYELVVLRYWADSASYEAHPSGQPTATFVSRAAPSDRGEIVFENPTHDFPQRIGYRPLGPDSLVAWIAGSRGGAERTIEFPYARVACTGP